MTIRLLSPISVAGVAKSIGDIITGDPAWEADQVNANNAVYTHRDLVQGEGLVPAQFLVKDGNVTGLVGPDGSTTYEIVGPSVGMRSRRKNFTAGLGDLLYQFSDHAVLTGVSAPVLETSTTVRWNDANTVKITSPSAGTTCGVQKTGLTAKLRAKSICIPVYIEDYTKCGSITVYMSHTTIGTNHVSYGYSLNTNPHSYYNGWHLIEITEDMWTTAGSGVTADGTAIAALRIDLQPRAGQVAVAYLGTAFLNTRSRANIIFTFDDGRTSQFTNAFPIMEKYGIPGTAYVIKTSLDNNSRWDDIDVLHEHGWCIANHANHNGVGTSDSYAEIGLASYVTQVAETAAELELRGYTGAWHHAYVEGSYDNELIKALKASGVKTARIIDGTTRTGACGMLTNFGVYRRHALLGQTQLNSFYSVADIEAEVDRAIRDGKTIIITSHDILKTAEGGAGALAWLASDFETLCAYVAAKRANGLCETPNIDTWYSSLESNQFNETPRN